MIKVHIFVLIPFEKDKTQELGVNEKRKLDLFPQILQLIPIVANYKTIMFFITIFKQTSKTFSESMVFTFYFIFERSEFII